MVDAVVSFVVRRLGDYLIHEVVSLRGVTNDVQSLKGELEWMQRFIEDAEEKQIEDAMVRKLISDMGDIAYEIEDVLDTFILGKMKRKPRLLASVKKCSCISSQDFSFKISSFYGLGKKIETLKQKINDLPRKRELYHLPDFGKEREGKSNTLDTLEELRKAPSFVVEENVVGFKVETRELLAKLLDEKPQRFVISICGMGGLGKTTLAKKLYRNKDVTNKFNHKAWVSVSQNYDTKDLLFRIIESFTIMKRKEEKENDEEMKKMRKMSKEQLELYIFELLQEGSYLLVIDDVWKKETWESLKRAFPDNKNGSRVIITTRKEEVAKRSDDGTHVHQLRFLNEDESWKLFCDKAFQEPIVDERFERMGRMGREMVKKCGGLPLAIVVLGGLLSTKKPQEWREVHRNIWQHLKGDSIHISYLLHLSFNDLPPQLKLCFLYLGLFPEDFEINVENLIRLLVAEGFILEDGDLIMEEVAENNVNKLISRSLVQIEMKCWGRIATCRIHDLLRDLAIEKAKQLNFVHICDEIRHSSSIHSSITSSSRRQAIYSESEEFLWLRHFNPSSRSLLFFNQQADGSLATTHQLTQLCSRFILLRVLDVEVSAKSLPMEIGKLVLLKYLRLRFEDVYNLPPSIVNLQRLQTLELNSYSRRCITLPTEILKLQELRHLIGFFEGPLLVDNLTNLQTLKYVNFKSWTTINPEKLVNLRELQLELRGTYDKARLSLESVSKLKNLRILSIWKGSGVSFESLQPLGHCQCLIDLRMKGSIEQLPIDMDELFPNLECLKLVDSLLKDDPMPSLEKLPNLTFLVLGRNSYIGKKLTCRANGFPLLEVLELRGLNALEEWHLDEEAMPKLRGLTIGGCYKLRIPERLGSIPLPCEWECIDTIYINESRYQEL